MALPEQVLNTQVTYYRYWRSEISALRKIRALYREENEVFKMHIDGCVVSALKGKSEIKKQKKVDEIVGLIARFRKAG